MYSDSTSFKAFQVAEISGDEPSYSGSIVQRHMGELPQGDVLINVAFSSLNFKDALSAHGNKGVTRSYPHTPGIDAAGKVALSSSPLFKEGDSVIVTGFDLGMNTAGGFAEYIRVPAHWVIHLPEGLGLDESMIYGTAGFTAALCVEKLLLNGLTPEKGEVLVTGATGGVGSMAIALLSQLGFDVVACTGKPEMQAFLLELGARTTITRDEMREQNSRPLLKERWAAAVDVVGGEILWNILRSLRYGGSVAACGLAGAPAFGASVFPFILRDVNLLGVDSVNVPIPHRLELWQKLAGAWRISQFKTISKFISFSQLEHELKVITEGRAVGRLVLDLSA